MFYRVQGFLPVNHKYKETIYGKDEPQDNFKAS